MGRCFSASRRTYPGQRLGGGKCGDNDDNGVYGTGTQASAITAWQGITGRALAVRRVYFPGLPPTAITADLQADADAGRAVALSMKPSTSLVAADRTTIDSFLSDCKSHGLVAQVAMYHEPAQELGSVPTYQGVQNFYGPTVSAYYPLAYCGQCGSGAGSQANYAAYISGIESLFGAAAIDFYCNDYLFTGTGSPFRPDVFAAAVTDPLGLPFGIWEMGANEGTQSSADITAYWGYLAGMFAARITAGKPAGYVCHYTKNPPSVNSTPVLYAGSFQVPLYQALADAVTG